MAPRSRRRRSQAAMDDDDDDDDFFRAQEDEEEEEDIFVFRAKLNGPVGPQELRDPALAFAPPPNVTTTDAVPLVSPSPAFLRALHDKLVKEHSSRVSQRIAEYSAAAGPASSAAAEVEGDGRPSLLASNLVSIPDVDAEKQALIAAAIAKQQAARKAYEAKESSMGVASLLRALRWVSPAEASCALDKCRGDPDRAAGVLIESKGRSAARQEVALLTGSILSEADEGMSRVMTSSTWSSQHSAGAGASGAANSGPWLTRRNRRGANMPPIDRKLRLDDALKQADTMEGWSEARKKAFAQREVNPNAYYYRFNDPGEAQRNGRWTDEEEKVFFARMAECGVDGKWGVFARVIPGRVGYQCSNFYRWLLEQGRVTDDRYVFDDKGKAHMRRSDGTVRGAIGASGGPVSATPSASASASAAGDGAASSFVVQQSAPAKQPKAKPAPAKSKPKASGTKRSASATSSAAGRAASKRSKAEADDDADNDPDDGAFNPLPGFIDPISMSEVRRPYMSPDGYVLGYRTWLRVLSQEPRNTCPFTKQPLTRRQLIVLTADNIEEYRASIRNME